MLKYLRLEERSSRDTRREMAKSARASFTSLCVRRVRNGR